MLDHSTEEWRPVPSYEDRYEISSLGRVRRVPRVLRHWTHKSGYQYVTFPDGERTHSYRLNRLVARAFHGEPPSNTHEANHLNGDKADNSASNLNWVTSSENQRHAYSTRLQRPGEGNGNAKLTEVDVRAIRTMSGHTHREIADRFGISKSNVAAILQGKSWRHV